MKNMYLISNRFPIASPPVRGDIDFPKSVNFSSFYYFFFINFMSLIQSLKTERNYIFKSIFTLLNNKQEVHLKSILKCRDLGKSSGDNPRALASGLSYVQVGKRGITI